MRWQVSFAIHLVLGAIAPIVGAAEARDVNFGPQNCVSLSKTAQGTCMLHTNCDTIDTSQFDFAFVCLTREGDTETQVKHEYGIGGFDSDEDYDTSVECDECLAEARPVDTPAAIADAHAQLQQYSAGAPAVQAPPPKAAAFYGPEGCIAAYRSSQGTCIVQTRCTSQAAGGLLKDYNYGLTCVDSAGESTRHLFGKNSFDAEETFDTLVECQLCLGFDGAPEGNATDTTLAQDVATLQDEVKDLQESVAEIKTQLGAGKASEKEETEEKAEEKAEGNTTETDAPAQLFLHKFRHHYAEAKPVKHHARSHHRAAARERDEDLDDLDEGDDLDEEDADEDLDY